MPFKWNLGAKGLVTLAVPLAFQIVLLVGLSTAQKSAEQTALKVERALQLSQLLSGLLQDFIEIRVNAARFRLQYLLSEQFYETRGHGFDQLHSLKNLLKDEPEHVAKIDRLERHAREASQTIQNEGGRDSYNHLRTLDEIADQMRVDILVVVELVENRENAVAECTEQLRHQDFLYKSLLLGGSAIEIAVLLLALGFFGRDITRRMKIMQHNSLLLAMGKPLGRRLEGADEISQLDKMFHQMAGELEEAAQIDSVLTENVKAVICTLDARLVFSATNSASDMIFGCPPAELIGTRLASVLLRDEPSAVASKIEKSKSKMVPPFEAQITRKDGSQLDTLWSVHWSSRESSYICVVHDNSARKEAERMREKLLSLVTDDLKKPLSFVSAFLISLKSDKFGELKGRGGDLASTATAATQQMLTLINDLLDIEQLESGTLKVNCEHLALSEVFAQALQAGSASAKRYGVELEANANSLEVFADRHRMMQVLTNLISNAVKFSPRGSKVSLDAKSAGDRIEIKVTDQGRGIPPDTVPFIFERFRQAELSDAIEKKGVGLGLSITKALVELQNGTICVDSVVGEGTVFTLDLPGVRKS